MRRIGLGEAAFAASKYSKERNFWVKKLSGELPKSRFPYDYIKTGISKYQKDTLELRLPAEIVTKLITLSNTSDARLYIILVTVLVVLIHKYTGDTDVIVGSPVYKQDSEGKFINTVLALRNRFNANMTFKELLLQVRQTVIEANSNQNYPFELLLKDLNETTSENNGFPLFKVAILLENIYNARDLQNIDLDMIFSFKKRGEFLEGYVEYNSLLYERTTIERMVKNLEHLLYEVLFNIDIQVSGIEAASGEEKTRVLFAFNDTKTEFPGNKSVPELFEEQAAKTPDHIAVVGAESSSGETIQITYRLLNEKVNQLAGFLRKKGVKPDTSVGIMMDPSIEMI
nr:AMP-binding protein [Candidatus Aminicenantes bacterium]NIM84051.1 AMP-binding protein [Candidatus Aminicenantes bacterium]NIN23515.1 AMP-binding protein [Candidatus Aminicenantes bacterium]NIN47220.1 AMP-binding protein [Candidatus Aminicenantes bacterium]NIN90146.1 AMP-binding protein [Candidatus Aminicenantes bacterium]